MVSPQHSPDFLRAMHVLQTSPSAQLLHAAVSQQVLAATTGNMTPAMAQYVTQVLALPLPALCALVMDEPQCVTQAPLDPGLSHANQAESNATLSQPDHDIEMMLEESLAQHLVKSAALALLDLRSAI